MSLIVFLLVLAVFLTIIGLMQPLANRLRLPLTVVLAVVGIVLGAGATFLLRTPLTNAFNDLALAILDLPIGSEVFLYVFLPTLLFQTALTLEVRRLLDDWVPIFVLAILAVVIATFVIGLALAPFGVQPLIVCLIVASIVATTDPSAVVSIFRDISAPGRLGRLIEGESLLNDATAIALFSVFVGLATHQTQVGVLAVIGNFLLTLAGGCAFGYLATRAGLFLLGIVREYRLAEMSISLAIPYVIYILAEQIIGVSGVIAVVFGGLTLNLMGPARLRPEDWDYLTATWDQLAFWAGTLVFTLAALLVPRLLGEVTLLEIGLIAVVVVAALAARAIVLFGVLPLLTYARLSPSVSGPYKLVIMWGGLRGSVTLALALSVTENPFLPADDKRFVAVLATGFVLFTLLVQGTTLRRVIRRLGLDRLSPLDAALRNHVIAIALQNVREGVAETAKSYGLAQPNVRAEAKRFGERLEAAIRRAEDGSDILDRDRITLGLLTLAGREHDIVLEQFRERLISLRLVDRMLADASRLIDRTRAGGRSEYNRSAARALAYPSSFRLAHLLQRRLGVTGPLQRQMAQRFQLLVTTRIILRELHGFTDQRVRPIHGERVSELIHEIVSRREEQVEQALDALRLQYPGYAEELERRFIRKTALRREELEYQRLYEDRLIGPELHRSLMRSLSAERRKEDQRLPLDLAMKNREILRTSALFHDADQAAVDRVAEALVTVFAAPGDVLIRRGDPPESVYFIASGAVEVDMGHRKLRLGRGEMFGEMAVLGRRPRRSEVRAISYANLFCLDEGRFRELMQAIPSLREHVERTAVERQVLGGPRRPRLPA
ncbi:cation:proton antiporter [Rubellimicrobium roseum]|uniref:Cyclic nucleotide-binding domain-containing protein n=1 Tax=Rubellimicrobium roseum TaxID=687525 RepID=A0A5C4NBH2_9RHOB|nr:cation:proton antiporter [Rubellimicrobium roseum]TNC66571.1 cyclic nucleotide-binding domain-containing protein [Rubellimicrobium roseum]